MGEDGCGDPAQVMRGRFLESFMPRYQRNNKRSGQKNLRCFPHCSANGHMSSGFCGRCLTLSMTNLEPLGPDEVVRCWGEFTIESEDLKEKYIAGSAISLNKVHEMERNRSNPLRPWISGEVSEGRHNTFTVVFNRQLLGWHYSWVSTKHKCDLYHVFKAYVFILDKKRGVLRSCGTISTPKFQLYSRRRQAQMSKEKEEAEEALRRAGKLDPVLATLASGSSSSSDGLHLMKKRRLDTRMNVAIRKRRSLIMDRLIRFLLSHSGQSAQTLFHRRDGSDPFAPGISDNSADIGDDFSGLLLSLLDDGTNRRGLPRTESLREFEKLLEEDDSKSVVSHSGSTISGSWKTPADDLDLFEQMRLLLMDKGGETTRAKAEEITEALKKLPESIIAVSSNRSDFCSFIARWSTPQGIEVLKRQLEKEKQSSSAMKGFVNEDEEVLEETPGVFKSIYGDMRNLFRNVLLEALSNSGSDLDDFQVPMELAAKYGLLSADPHYPPSRRVAALTHVQLFNSLEGFHTQDFGSKTRKFKDEQQRLAWVNAYWQLRRKTFRRLMIRRIAEERQGNLMRPNVAPVEPGWDINGTWVNCSKMQHSKLLLDLTKQVGGEIGELAARLFESTYRRLEIVINSEAMHLDGDRILLAKLNQTYFFDKVARKYTIPSPLPVSTWSAERSYVAWLERDDDIGEFYINLVTGGNTRSKHVDHYVKYGKRVVGEDDTVNAEAVERSQLRVAKRYFLTSDKETLFMSNRVHFFNDHNAPSFDDIEALKRLFQADLPSEYCCHMAKFIKVNSDGDDVLVS